MADTWLPALRCPGYRWRDSGLGSGPELRTCSAVITLLAKLRDVFRGFASQPVGRVIEAINPMLRGWVNYFAVGHASRCFSCIE